MGAPAACPQGSLLPVDLRDWRVQEARMSAGLRTPSAMINGCPEPWPTPARSRGSSTSPPPPSAPGHAATPPNSQGAAATEGAPCTTSPTPNGSTPGSATPGPLATLTTPVTCGNIRMTAGPPCPGQPG